MAAFELMLRLEREGFTLTVDPVDDAIVVVPFSRLTEDDQVLIRRWRPHIVAGLRYLPPTCA